MKNKLTFFFVFNAFIPILCFGQILIGVKGGYNFSAPLENPNVNHNDADLSVTQISYLISTYYKNRVPGKVVNLGFVPHFKQVHHHSRSKLYFRDNKSRE